MFCLKQNETTVGRGGGRCVSFVHLTTIPTKSIDHRGIYYCRKKEALRSMLLLFSALVHKIRSMCVLSIAMTWHEEGTCPAFQTKNIERLRLNYHGEALYSQ